MLITDHPVAAARHRIARRADRDPVGGRRDLHRAGSRTTRRRPARSRPAVPGTSRSTVTLVGDPFFILAPGRAEPEDVRQAAAPALTGIRGPLAVEGGTTAADRSIHAAVLLPGEGNAPPFERRRAAARVAADRHAERLRRRQHRGPDRHAHLDRADRPEHGAGASTSRALLAAATCPFSEPGKYPGGISYGYDHASTRSRTTSHRRQRCRRSRSSTSCSARATTTCRSPRRCSPAATSTRSPACAASCAHHGGITAVHGGGNQPLKVDWTFTISTRHARRARLEGQV